jgi:hypothetical protein
MDANVKQLKRLMTIYRVVQVFLLGLFFYMAWHFQKLFQLKGMPQIFFNSILTSLVIQLLVFYPVWKLAAGDARREVASVNAGVEEGKKLRQQRMYSDMLKASVFMFFATFIYLAPSATFFLSTALFSFILTLLAYAQCFNFTLGRLLRSSDKGK